MTFTDRNDDLMREAFAPLRGLEPSDAEVASVLGRTEPAPRPSAARRVGWGARRVVALGAASLALAGTAMAAAGVWNPSIGTEAPNSPPPSISHSPVSAPVAASLGVLRRGPTDQDHGTEVEATLRTLGKTLGEYGVEGVRPDSVRYVGPAADGKATILFSAEDAGFGLFLAGGPKAGSKARFLDGQGLCVYNGQGTPVCWVLKHVLTGEAFSWTGSSGAGSGLVPDGVTSVTASLQSGATVEAPVTDNYFRFSLDGGSALADAQGWEERPQIVWHDADGAVVKPKPRHHKG